MKRAIYSVQRKCLFQTYITGFIFSREAYILVREKKFKQKVVKKTRLWQNEGIERHVLEVLTTVRLM